MHSATRIAITMLAVLATHVAMAQDQGPATSWLDGETLASWNAPGQAIPTAPEMESANPRCKELVRSPQLREDEMVRNRGWDLVGAFQGGWNIVVISAAAGYDGMCRPLHYQSFVFVRGAFAGTLSPQPMDSRSDGALGQVWLQSRTQLTAEYSRYEESDALCCPSRRTSVVFEIPIDTAVVRPVSATTSPTPGNVP